MSKTTSALIALGVVAGLGAAALPLSTYADGNPKTAQVGVTLEIEDELSIEADKNTSDKLVDLSEGSDSVTLTVITNNQKGYDLTIKGSAEGHPTTLTSETGSPIVAGTGIPTAPAALDNSTDSQWGYRLTDWTANMYAGVTPSDVSINKTNTATTSTGDTTEVTFGVSLKDGQEAGTYNGEVTFTATNNPIVAE